LSANHADAVRRLLVDDWAVISAAGGMSDRAAFLAVIRSGDFTRKTMELLAPWCGSMERCARDDAPEDLGHDHGVDHSTSGSFKRMR